MSHHHFHAILLAATASIGMVACATNESQQDGLYSSAREAGDEVICRKQRPVGSHVPVLVCRTRRQMDRERDAAVDSVGILRTMTGDLPPPPSPPPN
jgi:hypothetical protein